MFTQRRRIPFAVVVLMASCGPLFARAEPIFELEIAAGNRFDEPVHPLAAVGRRKLDCERVSAAGRTASGHGEGSPVVGECS